MINTIIITTGDELLYGTTTDTNSSFISWRLFGTDFHVVKHITVGDQLEVIVNALRESISIADLIIVTGGLGPTDDDNTVKAVCTVFNRDIVTDSQSDKSMTDYFRSMKINRNDVDYKMVTIPHESIVLQNLNGLAPGFIIEDAAKTLVALPGVPAEAEKMFNEKVLPYLKSRYNYNSGNRIMLKLTGIRESDINVKINSLMLNNKISWGISAKYGVCDLCFFSSEPGFYNKDEITSILKEEFRKYLVGDNFKSPEDELISLLRQKKMSISTAESCTGGLLSKRFTDIPGSSEVYTGSVIAYSNLIKATLLGVKQDTLDNYGAVSEETAGEMVKGISRLFNTDIGIAVTGIAGPGGGTIEKPVGTVCFGFYINKELITRKEHFGGDRDRIRIFASLYAINFIRNYLFKL